MKPQRAYPIALHGRRLIGVMWLCAGVFAGTPALADAASAERQGPVPGDYRVVNGRVDPGTYAGWRLFHTACHGCHGVDAAGTDLAPNLVERVKAMSQRDFATKLLTSYRLLAPEAQADGADRSVALDALIEQVLRRDRTSARLIAMPAWDDNPRVRPHVLDLYAYLTARADGQLAPGKPKQIGDR